MLKQKQIFFGITAAALLLSTSACTGIFRPKGVDAPKQGLDVPPSRYIPASEYSGGLSFSSSSNITFLWKEGVTPTFNAEVIRRIGAAQRGAPVLKQALGKLHGEKASFEKMAEGLSTLDEAAMANGGEAKVKEAAQKTAEYMAQAQAALDAKLNQANQKVKVLEGARTSTDTPEGMDVAHRLGRTQMKIRDFYVPMVKEPLAEAKASLGNPAEANLEKVQETLILLGTYFSGAINTQMFEINELLDDVQIVTDHFSGGANAPAFYVKTDEAGNFTLELTWDIDGAGEAFSKVKFSSVATEENPVPTITDIEYKPQGGKLNFKLHPQRHEALWKVLSAQAKASEAFNSVYEFKLQRGPNDQRGYVEPGKMSFVGSPTQRQNGGGKRSGGLGFSQ